MSYSDSGSSYSSINGGSSYSSVISGSDSTGYSYNYSGGNKYISDFESGDMINIPADFTGIDYDDSDFMIYSSSGSLTVQNIRDKVMDFGFSGTSFVKICLMENATRYDGTGVSVNQIVYGSTGNDSISAGSGGSLLWGGLGGNDTLIGGAGEDTFMYAAGGGNDVIKNAGWDDVVNMSSISVFDLSSIQLVGTTIKFGTNSGGSLSIESSSSYLSPDIQLAEGTVYYNFYSDKWQLS